MQHTTLSGQIIECEPSAAVAKFIELVRKATEDRKVTEDALVALVYGKENPLLDQSVFAARGAVTPEVLAEPAYHVLADYLVRKRVQVEGTDPAKLAARYTLTVAEAATRKGVTPDGIRKAIRERRLPAWVKNGELFIEPRTLDAMSLGKRGALGPESKALQYDVGYDPDADAFVKFKVPGGELPLDRKGDKGRITNWGNVAVLTGGHGKARFFELVPSTETDPEAIEFHGFFVRGKFQVIRKVNNPKAAREAWEAFKAS